MRQQDYFFGGYLVTQPVDRPEAMSADLLPARLLTASGCIANFVPDAWCMNWTSVDPQERQAAARSLGLDPGLLPELTRQTSDLFNEGGHYGWPNIVKSIHGLAALMRLLPAEREWVVLGLALHEIHSADFLADNAPPEGCGAGGAYEMIAQHLPIPPHGQVLGFEPLGFEYGGEPHSWLCKGLETECFRALGIRPALNGFIADEQMAERAIEHISKDEVGAEPVLWLPWLIIDYGPWRMRS